MRVLVPLFVTALCAYVASGAETITLDGSKVERTFDGIGGLSGGGATSRLLWDYTEPYRSQVLDYLFKPNFGASLHILKVEIGGDCQTTDGTESSHMHTRDDQNYERGYEWWLMVEAKKRNPNILIYALAWGVPGWIGNGNFFSQDNVDYHVNWIKAAKSVYNVTVDFVGIWNERACTSAYIKLLRTGLDKASLQHTKIVACDGNFGIVSMMDGDRQLAEVIPIVGVHYPGTLSPANAISLNNTALWASEDFSTYADSSGGGCWARILNQNYVNGYMTSTISWNLVAAYYAGLPFYGDGLMWSVCPWTGNYQIKSPIWISAHTTQFTQPGWKYLAHGSGVGHFAQGGSYVTLVPPNNSKGDFTLIIELMTHDHSKCIRPDLPAYNVVNQNVTFVIGKDLMPLGGLYLWKSFLSQDETKSVLFEKQPNIIPQHGSFTLQLETDSVYTISTLNTAQKGSYPSPPACTAFPVPYKDTFDSYKPESEAKYFADQTGTFAIYKPSSSSADLVMRQVVTRSPITWCSEAQSPISFIGSSSWTDFTISIEVLIESTGYAVVGGRASAGGCGNNYNSGYFFTLGVDGAWNVTAGPSKVLAKGNAQVKAGQWYTMVLSLQQETVTGKLDQAQVFSVKDASYKQGFAAIGTSWNYVQFNNLFIN